MTAEAYAALPRLPSRESSSETGTTPGPWAKQGPRELPQRQQEIQPYGLHRQSQGRQIVRSTFWRPRCGGAARRGCCCPTAKPPLAVHAPGEAEASRSTGMAGTTLKCSPKVTKVESMAVAAGSLTGGMMPPPRTKGRRGGGRRRRLGGAPHGHGYVAVGRKLTNLIRDHDCRGAAGISAVVCVPPTIQQASKQNR